VNVSADGHTWTEAELKRPEGQRLEPRMGGFWGYGGKKMENPLKNCHNCGKWMKVVHL
jgi:hypothetical protein